MMRIWVVGVDTLPGFPDSESVSWRDPQSGQLYVAHSYGTEVIDGKTVQRGIAARALEWMNTLTAKAYSVDPAIVNPTGEQTVLRYADNSACPPGVSYCTGQPIQLSTAFALRVTNYKSCARLHAPHGESVRVLRSQLARRVLSGRLCSSLLLVLSLAGCRHEDRSPAPSASASALGNDFTTDARERHFQQELARAGARFRSDPGLAAKCAGALKEQADLELCQAAAAALAAIAAEPAATPEQALPRLAPGALAFARLSERVRVPLARRARAAARGRRRGCRAGSLGVRGRRASSQRRFARAQSARPGASEQHALELRDGPVSQLLGLTIVFERDLIRNLGAYLEYGPLPCAAPRSTR